MPFALVFFLFFFLSLVEAATKTPTLTVIPTKTSSSTNTLSSTATATPTSTFTLTPSSTSTSTATLTSTATKTPTSSCTLTVTSTDTPTATRTRTFTPTNTLSNTISPTITCSRTETYSQSASQTITQSFTLTQSLTGTFSETDTLTTPKTASVTCSDTSTKTISLTATNTRTRSITSTASETLTSSRTPTATFSCTPTMAKTASPTTTSTLTMKVSHSATPTSTPTMKATLSSSATPTKSSTCTKTRSATCTKSRTNTRTSTSTRIRTISATPTPTSTKRITKTSTPTLTRRQKSLTMTLTSTATLTKKKTSTSTSTSTQTVRKHSNTPTLTSTVTKTNSKTATLTATRTHAKVFIFVCSGCLLFKRATAPSDVLTCFFRSSQPFSSSTAPIVTGLQDKLVVLPASPLPVLNSTKNEWSYRFTPAAVGSGSLSVVTSSGLYNFSFEVFASPSYNQIAISSSICQSSSVCDFPTQALSSIGTCVCPSDYLKNSTTGVCYLPVSCSDLTIKSSSVVTCPGGNTSASIIMAPSTFVSVAPGTTINVGTVVPAAGTATSSLVFEGTSSSSVFFGAVSILNNIFLTSKGTGTNEMNGQMKSSKLSTTDSSGNVENGGKVTCRGASFEQSVVQSANASFEAVSISMPSDGASPSTFAATNSGEFKFRNFINGPLQLYGSSSTSALTKFTCGSGCTLVGTAKMTICNSIFLILASQNGAPPLVSGGTSCSSLYSFASGKNQLQATGSQISIYGAYDTLVTIGAGSTLGLDLSSPASFTNTLNSLKFDGSATISATNVNSVSGSVPTAVVCSGTSSALSLAVDATPSTTRIILKCTTVSGTISLASSSISCGSCTCTATFIGGIFSITPACTVSPVSSVVVTSVSPSAIVLVASASPSAATSSDIAWIAGPIVGGVVLFALIIGVAAYCLMKPSHSNEGFEVPKEDILNELVVDAPGMQRLPPYQGYYTQAQPVPSPSVFYAPQPQMQMQAPQGYYVRPFTPTY